MSNLLFLDESNGNGVYANKSNSPAKLAATAEITDATNCTTTTTTQQATTITKANNLDNIMATNAGATAAAVVAAGANLSTSVSNEDLSLSEYTDADESISAPTEFLAEFLSAVMLKDYKKALKYCKLILQYEPNNATAKEFYPLILEKLRGATSSDSDENYNKSSSPELALELQSAYQSAGDSDEAASEDQKQNQQQQNQHATLNNVGDDSDDYIAHDENEHYSGEVQTSNSSSGGVGNESLSSVSMEEDDDDEGDDIDDDDDVDDIEDDDDDCDVNDDDDVLSSSGDDLPNDVLQLSLDNASGAGGLDNASHSSRNSSGAEGGRSRSDNTTHSYSSLLLEEEDDMLPTNMPFVRDKYAAHELDVSNGNNVPSTSCSDSESPTEPLTQRLAAILLSKCGVSSSNGENF